MDVRDAVRGEPIPLQEPRFYEKSICEYAELNRTNEDLSGEEESSGIWIHQVDFFQALTAFFTR